MTRTLVRFFCCLGRVRDNSTCSSRAGRAIKLSEVFLQIRIRALSISASSRLQPVGPHYNNPRSVERLSITWSRDQWGQRAAIFLPQSSAESFPHLPNHTGVQPHNYTHTHTHTHTRFSPCSRPVWGLLEAPLCYL